MKFSIVINSFNQSNTIERTIISVLNQEVEKEVIVIDAGSTDGSVEIINKYANYLDVIIFNPGTDLGQSHAINQGFANSTGSILCWINSDDWFEKDGLSQIVSYFQDNKNPLTWVIASCNLWNETKKEVFSVRSVNHVDLGIILEYGSMFWIPQQSTFWRRELFELCGPLVVSDHVTMDVELFMRFSAISKPILSKEIVSSYSFHDQSKGSVFRKESFISQNKLRLKYARAFKPFFVAQKLNEKNIPVHFSRAVRSDLQRYVKHLRG